MSFDPLGSTASNDLPRVGVVVVHWRGMRATHNCLESLSALTYPDVDVVVVVNGAGDFDEDSASAVCPRLRVVRSPANLGYAGGCNIGARAVFGGGAGYVLLLNNDTVVIPGMVEPLVAACAGAVGICGPVVTYHGEQPRVWSAGGYINETLGYTRHVGFNAVAPPATAKAVDFVNGCAMLVGRQTWEQLGGMDERYFHYFEDVDLCVRARAMGLVSFVVAEPAVRHAVSASAGAQGSNRLNRMQAYYFTRNRWHFLARNAVGLRRYSALVSQLILLFPYETLKDMGQRNWGALAGRCAGLWDAVRGRTGPMRSPGGQSP
jgi:GT2 family glycosyltransferase